MGKIVHGISKMLTSQLLVCCYVNLKTKGCPTFLPPRIVGQQLASDNFSKLWQFTTRTWELLKLKDWEPNKL
jgi:hypothetical protein